MSISLFRITWIKRFAFRLCKSRTCTQTDYICEIQRPPKSIHFNIQVRYTHYSANCPLCVRMVWDVACKHIGLVLRQWPLLYFKHQPTQSSSGALNPHLYSDQIEWTDGHTNSFPPKYPFHDTRSGFCDFVLGTNKRYFTGSEWVHKMRVMWQMSAARKGHPECSVVRVNGMGENV